MVSTVLAVMAAMAALAVQALAAPTALMVKTQARLALMAKRAATVAPGARLVSAV
jgi:hypothetical protein